MNIKALMIASAAAAAAMISSGAQASTVVNGDFSAGNTGFTSGYGYLAPAGQGTLYPEGFYTVDTNPNNVHDLWSSFGDHTTGSGEMMIVNGAPTANVTVWDEVLTGLTTNTNYFFSAWVASSYPTNPAQLDFSINGASIGTLTPPTTTGQWTQFYVAWNSGANTSADIGLINQNTVRDGNDFALDDIDFGTTNPGGVPEPATWSLMIGGMGLAGAMLRRRKAVPALA
jgi:hypothetical protein